jgi:hypothetical protein
MSEESQMEYHRRVPPINIHKGKTSEGYSNCESTQVCGGKQINETLAQNYKQVGDYRLPRNPTMADYFKDKKKEY